MAKIDVTKTELVWPGKYNEDGTIKEVPRVNLPFQVIETVNESRATREAQKTTSFGLFDVYEGKEGDTFEAGWRNKLIWGDNLLVMGSLLEKFAGKIDLVYIDPPFLIGADFSFTSLVGEAEVEVHKEQSSIEEKAYRDTWGGWHQFICGDAIKPPRVDTATPVSNGQYVLASRGEHRFISSAGTLGGVWRGFIYKRNHMETLLCSQRHRPGRGPFGKGA